MISGGLLAISKWSIAQHQLVKPVDSAEAIALELMSCILQAVATMIFVLPK
jgi:hypothetical protein